MSIQKTKILIGEDERPIARAIQLKLTSVGYQVQVAYDGLEVMRILKADLFDLVLLDLIMPKLNGFGVLEEL